MSTVTVVATVETTSVPPRVRLDVTDVGTPNLFAVTVTRLDPDGRTVPVRTIDGAPLVLSTSGASRVGLVYDYEMPYGVAVQYSTQEDPSSSSGEVTVPVDEVWLVHPGVPALSRPIRASEISGRTRPVERGVFRPMGRKYPLVVTDGQRRSAEYTLTVRSTTDSEREAIDNLLEDAGVLLLNVPATKRWGMTTEYVSVGDVVEDRLWQYAREPRRHWQLPLIVVDRPAGGTTAQRTYVDLLVYATYADLLAAYPTYFDLLAGP